MLDRDTTLTLDPKYDAAGLITAVVVDRHGAPLQQVRIDANVRRLPWVALADISPALRAALLASEDKRFYQHAGVDWDAVAAAAWGSLWHSRTRGASTITMQLAGLLDDGLVVDVRGVGGVWAVSVPAGADPVAVRDRVLALGVVVRPIAPATLAVCPPLVIRDAELDEVVGALRSALGS